MPRSPSAPKSSARLRAEGFGRRAETIAAWLLRLKGYRIIAKRVKTPLGELDLVATRFDVTAFVEVKARMSREALDLAHGQVDTRRIVRAAEFWLSRHPQHAQRTLRFDVIFVAPRTLPRHMKAAFDAS
jgi:putative endonuclease